MATKFNSPQETLGYIGNGALLVGVLDENDEARTGFRNLGQISSAVVALSSEKVELADTMQGTLSTSQSIVVRNTAELTATLKSFSPENLALALYGESVLEQEEIGASYTFEYIPGNIEVVPGIISGNARVELVADARDVTDSFIFNGGSIYAKKTENDPNGLVDGDEVVLTYDKASLKRVEGFINSSINVQLVFDGFNIANQDKAVKVTYYKVALDPAAQRQLISSDFADQEIRGTLLASNAVSGVGVSKLFKEEHQQ